MRDLTKQLELRRLELARNDQNRARQAAAFAKLTSTGQGTVEYEDSVDFGCSFIEEPFVQYGSYIDLDELRNTLDIDDGDDVPIPVVSGSVVDWDMAGDRYYTGAWVGITVAFPSGLAIDAAAAVSVTHYFKFEGIAMKSVNVSGLV